MEVTGLGVETILLLVWNAEPHERRKGIDFMASLRLIEAMSTR